MAESTDMQTHVALGCYYLAIILLVLFAGVIVVKLIFLPPCTQLGNACVVDGWSVAGLATMVLAVAATMLAILGAVAVAAWWTSLNDRVKDQVKGLYEAQKKEVNTQVDHLLAEQQKKVGDQLVALHDRVREVHAKIDHSLELVTQAVRNTAESKKLVDDMAAAITSSSVELAALKKTAQEYSEFLDRVSKIVNNPPNFLDGIPKVVDPASASTNSSSTP